MAFIFNMFGNNPNAKKGNSGGGPKKQKANPNAAIQTLRTAITKLTKREEHLNKQIEACEKKAKLLVKKKNKKGAMLELKKKRKLEKKSRWYLGTERKS